MLQFQQASQPWQQLQSKLADRLFQQLITNTITINNLTLHFKYYLKGKRPQRGYTLIFGFHGGGGCPAQVNDQQYNNHQHLYDSKLPDGCIWFVPRSIQNLSDMWWRDYMQDFLYRIIQTFVLRDIVDPNKVFVTGFSAGGDGIYHMAPRMADAWAGAAMMAGHPNQVQIENCRNIMFSIQVGAQDHAYNRNSLAHEYISKLNSLRDKYGGFDQHLSRVHMNKSHWMNLQDAQMFPQFFQCKRNPYPDLVLFRQHPRRQKKSLYYVKVDPGMHTDLLEVRKQGNIFYILSEMMPVTIMVNRLMVDINQPVIIYHNEDKTITQLPMCNPGIIRQSIKDRIDPWYIFEDQFISVPTRDKSQAQPLPYPPTQTNQGNQGKMTHNIANNYVQSQQYQHQQYQYQQQPYPKYANYKDIVNNGNYNRDEECCTLM